MLRVSKRCRLLVSLLLLCGCFLSFSSVSFASSINMFDGKTFYSNTDVPVAGLSRTVAVSSLRPEVEFIGSSGNLNYYNAYERDYFTFTLTNTTDTPFVFQPDLIVRFQAYYSDMVFDNGITWNGGKATYIENQHADVWTVGLSSSGSPSSQIAFRVAPNYNTSFVLYPHQTVSLSFTLVRVYYLSSNTSNNYSNNIAYTLYNQVDIKNLYTGLPSGEFNSSFVPPVSSGSISQGESNIDSAIQSQTQQQQQQHEEQMEQSQQQYDDFTDSGSSEGSDLIAGTEEDIKEKIGIFTFLDNLIQRFLGLFVSSNASTSITLPAFTMNIQGRDYQIWNEYTFDLSSLDGPFSVLMTAVRFATVATVYFAFLGYLQNTYKRIIGGSNG